MGCLTFPADGPYRDRGTLFFGDGWNGLFRDGAFRRPPFVLLFEPQCLLDLGNPLCDGVQEISAGKRRRSQLAFEPGQVGDIFSKLFFLFREDSWDLTDSVLDPSYQADRIDAVVQDILIGCFLIPASSFDRQPIGEAQAAVPDGCIDREARQRAAIADVVEHASRLRHSALDVGLPRFLTAVGDTTAALSQFEKFTLSKAADIRSGLEPTVSPALGRSRR